MVTFSVPAPLLLRVIVPRDVEPSVTATLPVGTGPLELTWTVNATAWVVRAGFGAALADIVVATLLTVTFRGEDVLEEKLVSPAYFAVMG
jgi:hypothetical protein